MMKFYNSSKYSVIRSCEAKGGRSFSERSPHTHEFKTSYRIKENNDPHKFMTGVGVGAFTDM